jgi:hypothetical protein
MTIRSLLPLVAGCFIHLNVHADDELTVRGLQSYCEQRQIFPLKDLFEYSKIEGNAPTEAIRHITYSGFDFTDLYFLHYKKYGWVYSLRNNVNGGVLLTYKFVSELNEQSSTRVLALLKKLTETARSSRKMYRESGSVTDDGLVMSISFYDKEGLCFFTFQGSSEDTISDDAFSNLLKIWNPLVNEIKLQHGDDR